MRTPEHPLEVIDEPGGRVHMPVAWETGAIRSRCLVLFRIYSISNGEECPGIFYALSREQVADLRESLDEAVRKLGPAREEEH